MARRRRFHLDRDGRRVTSRCRFRVGPVERSEPRQVLMSRRLNRAHPAATRTAAAAASTAASVHWKPFFRGSPPM